MDPKKIAFIATAISVAREALHSAQHVTFDDALGTIGLERRTPMGAKILLTVGLVGLGAVSGAGVALLLAPTTGRDLRSSVAQRLAPAKKRLLEATSALADREHATANAQGQAHGQAS